MSDFEQYYIHRKGDFVGNAPMWWAKGGNGYTSYILGAERFSKEDADALISSSGDKYKVYRCSDVDARLHLVYDVQDDKRLGTDAPCGWPGGYAAIASMQGEAVAWRIEVSREGWKYGNYFYHDKKFESDRHVRLLREDKSLTAIQSPLFTHAPDSAARIAEQDAEIDRLKKELDEARTKSRNLVELVLVAREWHWVPCSQASDYVNHELFPRNQKFPGTNQNNNNKPMWNAIDAAIRQIGGGE